MKRLGLWDMIGGIALAIFLAALVVSYLRIDDAQRSVTDAVLDSSQDIQTGHEWMGLYYQNQRVGYAHVEKRSEGEAGYTYEVDTRLETTSLGNEIRLELDMEAKLTKALELDSFTFSIQAGPAKFIGRGRVNEKELSLSIDTGGHTIERTIALKTRPALKSMMGPSISRLDLTPGKIHRFPVFDPVTQSNQTVEIEVIGPDTVVVVDTIVPVTHIRQRISGMTLNAWLNSRGEMLRQELGMGLLAVRETEAQAKSRASVSRVDIAETTKIPIRRRRVTKRRGRERILSVRGKGLDGFDLSDHRQTVEGNRITIQLEKKRPGLPLATARIGPLLASEPLIQSDHPSIIKVANEALGNAQDTVSGALNIMRWVHGNVNQRSVIGVPSAIETLKNRVGDCNEHTNLFIALGRAAGIPTRSVVGLMYADGRYGYHAWAEIQTEGGWLSVDPTWNQAPVDLNHLALIRGGLVEQAKLIQLFGNLEITFEDR